MSDKVCCANCYYWSASPPPGLRAYENKFSDILATFSRNGEQRWGVCLASDKKRTVVSVAIPVEAIIGNVLCTASDFFCSEFRESE